MIRAAAIRSPAGSSISAANARSAVSVLARADSRRASAPTGPAISAGAVRALASSASSSPRLAVSMSASRRAHCSSASRAAVRRLCCDPDISRGRNSAAATAESPATGQRVISSTPSPATTASSTRRPDPAGSRARSTDGGVPGAGARRVSSAASSTSPAATSAPATAASTFTGGRPFWPSGAGGRAWRAGSRPPAAAPACPGTASEPPRPARWSRAGTAGSPTGGRCRRAP